nr:PREDICTED: DNA replication complex GINS protein PSF3 [Opisthocomus hoazin]
MSLSKLPVTSSASLGLQRVVAAILFSGQGSTPSTDSILKKLLQHFPLLGWGTTNVVDLHKMGPYYYGLGSQLLNFDNPENPEIAQTILQTFVSRFRRIMDSSQNAYNEDTSALVAQLDELERALFRAGQKGLNDFQCWEKGQASQITASSLVQNYGKRKFADTDG